jgi:hypothetical protein
MKLLEPLAKLEFLNSVHVGDKVIPRTSYTPRRIRPAIPTRRIPPAIPQQRLPNPWDNFN